MAKVLFITLYDESCPGLRWVIGSVEAAGHETHLVHLKRFGVDLVPYRNQQLVCWIENECPYIVTPWYHTTGKRYCSFPHPISDHERELLLQKIEEVAPDYVGLSVLWSHLKLATDLSEMIRERFPNIQIIWGGTHPIIRPEECVGPADIVCTGEGERSLVELLDNPGKTDIPGLWFKNGSHGPIRNERAQFVEDLDSLPFPVWGLREWLIEYGKIASEDISTLVARGHFRLQTMRNCPYVCAYCYHSVARELFKGKGKYVRRRSPEHVIEEIRRCKQQFPLVHIVFSDEIFVVGRDWCLDFAEKYKASGLDIRFYGNCHPHTSKEEMLQALHDAGMWHTQFGIQCASERVRENFFARHTTNEEDREFLKMLQRVGFERITLDLINNIPQMEEEDCWETLEFFLSLPKPFELYIYQLTFYPTCNTDTLPNEEPKLSQKEWLFWTMIFLLTQGEDVDPDTIRALGRDPYLRENPVVLSDLVDAVLRWDERWDLYAQQLYLEGRLEEQKNRPMFIPFG
jgi:radical SAM superfamily enzyme YgiQ (UPF0313 family)